MERGLGELGVGHEHVGAVDVDLDGRRMQGQDGAGDGGRVDAVAGFDQAPQRSANGSNTQVYFENKSKQPVNLVWITYGGGLKQYADLAPGATRQQNTYSRNAWMITDQNDKPLGYFLIKEDEALAIIPPLK